MGAPMGAPTPHDHRFCTALSSTKPKRPKAQTLDHLLNGMLLAARHSPMWINTRKKLTLALVGLATFPGCGSEDNPMSSAGMNGGTAGQEPSTPGTAGTKSVGEAGTGTQDPSAEGGSSASPRGDAGAAPLAVAGAPTDPGANEQPGGGAGGASPTDTTQGGEPSSAGAASTPEATPPEVKLVSPAAGATDASPDSVISLQFSQAMDKATATAALTLSVGKVKTDPAKLCAGGWAWASKRSDLVTCTPAQFLPLGVKVVVNVAASATNLAGVALLQPQSFTFNVGSPVPAVVSTSPATAAVRVARSSTLTLEFNEPMDTTSVESNFGLAVNDALWKGSFAWQNCVDVGSCRTAVYSFGSPPPYGGAVSWKLLTGAKDRYGTPLPETVTGTFTLVKEVSMRIAGEARDGFLTQTNGAVDSGTATQTYLLVGGLIDVGKNQILQRSFVSFDLSALPKSTPLAPVTLTRATLRVYQQKNSFPKTFPQLNSIFFDHVAYDTLDATDWDRAAVDHLGNSGLLSTNDTEGERTTNVSDSVLYDFAHHAARSQFRLYFSREAKISTETNSVDFGSSEIKDATRRPWLDVFYEELPPPLVNQ